MKKKIGFGISVLFAGVMMSCGSGQKDDGQVDVEIVDTVEVTEEHSGETALAQETVAEESKGDCLVMGLKGNVKNVTVGIGYEFGPEDFFTASMDEEGLTTTVQSEGCECSVERGVNEGYKFVQYSITDLEEDYTVYVQFGYDPSTKREDYFSVITESEGMPDVCTYLYDAKGEVTGVEREFYDAGMQYEDLHKGDNEEDRMVTLEYKLTGISKDNNGNWVARSYKNSRGEYLYEKRTIEYYD